ncbi:MAG: hypothetical protein U9R29_07960 [Thermodesulfobacteriota bacterium]|nr:hypothetical protein [Thermodesulfobacteriota bacterium]
MSKKKNKNKSRAKRGNQKAALGKLNVKQLFHNGNRLYELGKYADAIAYVCELVKREPEDEALQLLARCYQKRILELQQKGLVREAIAICDSMKQQCQVSAQADLLVTMYCQCCEYEKAVTVYQQNIDGFDSKTRATLEELFGAAALAGHKQLLDNLPEDIPLRSHYHLANTVLTSYCLGNLEVVGTELKKIPFRSPYKNFRTLISGLIQVNADSDRAQKILEKIPSSSPYYDLGNILSVANMTVAEKLTQLETSDKKGCASSTLSVLGLNREKGHFLLKLIKAKQDEPKLLRLLLTNKNYFSKYELTNMATRLLVYCSNPEPVSFAFVKQKSTLEIFKIEALIAEIAHDLDFALEAWDEFLQRLPSASNDYALRYALVLRKQAQLCETLPSYSEYDSDDGYEKLLKSVELDPDDRDSWLRIIELSHKHEKPAEAYRIVKRALDQFPNDLEILLKTIDATTKRGAFKKAADLAQRLLKKDPINVRAQQLLAECHLAHGHKLYKQKKYSLAEKEFSAIEARSRYRSIGGRSYICLAMLAIATKEHSKGEDLLEKSKEFCTSPLMSTFLAAFESRCFRLPKTNFDKELRAACKEDIDRDECYFLSDWYKRSVGEERQNLKNCLMIMKSYFISAVALPWSRDEATAIAQTLYSCEFYPQLKKISTKYTQRDPHDSYFSFMEIVAQSHGGKKTISWDTSERLHCLVDEAWFKGDALFAKQVTDFVKKCPVQTEENINSGGIYDDGFLLRELEKIRIEFESKQNDNNHTEESLPQTSQLDLFGDNFDDLPKGEK